MTTEESKPIPIKIEKPSPHRKKGEREKCCATCGKPFTLEPDKKFFDCPACYQKKSSAQKAKKRSETKVINQIQCASCGMIEFIGFVPDDPTSVLCKRCFTNRVREQKKRKQHFHFDTGDI